ncbi:uncharacterized protein IUM83_03837 [Phytophthora cinnamomi]|uniref:uncharacterized protein n=1 Tax=Phytophthora cinnamomi TaxID=4785 RepID=UPI00355A72BF|nr:hypothetical protein IUM83_03837 [Phytophthora cinnamomi]
MAPRPLRRASLRPVLLLLLAFVLAPLAVYHVATFDFQRVASFERRFHLRPAASSSSSSSSVPACLAVAGAELLRADADALRLLQARCRAPETVAAAKSTRKLRLVHFVHVARDAAHGAREQFSYLQLAALQSARRALRPDVMLLHYVDATPRGVWYTQCQRHLGLHQVLPPAASLDGALAGAKLRRVTELLLMLRALRKHGGVAFADFNTFLLRAVAVDVQAPLVVAGTSSSSTGAFSLGLRVMQAPPAHPFVAFLEQEVHAMVERNDPKLHRLPLEEVVGQLVLDKFKQERGAARNSTGVMDGVVVATPDLFGLDVLHDLLTKKLGPSLAGKFRGVAGFHVDRDGESDAADFREIERMQRELTLADEWQSLDTLLGAVVRLAVTANTTAELEPLFE